MTRLLPLMLLLAACQGGVMAAMPQEPGPDAAACRRETENDPEIRRIGEQAVATNAALEQQIRDQLFEAIPRVYRACMIRRGATPQGGVERVRRSTL